MLHLWAVQQSFKHKHSCASRVANLVSLSNRTDSSHSWTSDAVQLHMQCFRLEGSQSTVGVTLLLLHMLCNMHSCEWISLRPVCAYVVLQTSSELVEQDRV